MYRTHALKTCGFRCTGLRNVLALFYRDTPSLSGSVVDIAPPSICSRRATPAQQVENFRPKLRLDYLFD
jgi:hypothetical protein